MVVINPQKRDNKSVRLTSFIKKNISFVIISFSFFVVGCSSGQFVNYITTKKDKLMDGDKVFRFVSFNIPNLHYIEDYLDFDQTNPWRLPNEFEIRDALETIKQMNGKVARMYVLSVRKKGVSKEIIRHLEAPGVINEEAFKTIDKVMQIANEVGPVKVNFLKIVDELADDSKIFKKNGVIEQILFKEIYQVKEDDTRLEAESGASVIYKVPESISSFLVDVFMRNNVCGISLLAADSLDNFTPLAAKIESFPPRKNVYGFLTPVKYSCDEFPYGTKYVKILCNDEAQLSRVEIEYTKK